MPKVKQQSSSGTWAIDPIPFVRQSSDGGGEEEREEARHVSSVISGNDARSFYESLLDEEQPQPQAGDYNGAEYTHTPKKAKRELSRAKRSSKVKSESTSNANENPQHSIDFFKMRNGLFSAAECGNMKELKRLVRLGVDVNCQDQYGWTALMCASHSGHCSLVTYLLDHGADASVRNSKGHNPWDIAQLTKRHQVIEALTNHGKPKEVDKQEIEHEAFVCEICEERIHGISQEKHAASTVHQLNLKHPVNDTAYGIPGSNRGFQLMLKSGWEQDKGLGPSGSGQKYPIKTHLKRDRKGLGIKEKNSKAKVTHFSANDKSAIEHKGRVERSATLGKRAAAKKEKKEKEIERQFRMEFWTE